MKKISKLLALAAALTSVYFMGCTNFDDDSESGTVSDSVSTSSSVEKDYNVQLFTEDGEALDLTKWGVGTSSSSRTIVSDGLGAAIEDNSKVTFWLYGSNQLNASDTSITNPKNVTFKLTDSAVSTSVGKVTLGLSASRWNLTLVACDADQVASTATPTEAQVKAAAYYIGYANVDLRTATSIKFYLSADGLTGNGGAKLTFRYDGITGGTWSTDHINLVKNANAPYTVSADITSRLQNITSSPQAIDVSKFFPTTPSDSSAAADAAGSTLEWTSIAPGTYNLEVKFTSPSSDDDTAKSYVWSDIIIILPNQTIEKTIDIPDIVLFRPIKPASFKVGYVTPTSKVTNSYEAVLTWEDSSNNEKYFEVQVANIASDTTALSAAVTTDALWSGHTSSLPSGSIQTLGEDFYGNNKNSGWVAGSLIKNNKSAVVKLSLGNRYLLRIAAVNDAGHSDWVYATYDLATATSAISTGITTKSYTPTAYGIYEVSSTTNDYAVVASSYAICANLYRLTYHLNGGSYTFASGGTATTADLVYYLSQKTEAASTPNVESDGIPILYPTGNPAAATPTYPQLIKNSNRWTSWRRGAIEGDIFVNTNADYPSYSATTPTPTTVDNLEVYKPANYFGYQNLDLFASFTVASAAVEVYVDSYYNFLDGELSLTGATGSGKAYTFTYTSSTSTTAMSLKYTQTTASHTFSYDSVSVEIKNVATGVVVANGTMNPSTNTYNFDIAAFGDGKFYISTVGEYKGKQYSYGIILTIVDES